MLAKLINKEILHNRNILILGFAFFLLYSLYFLSSQGSVITMIIVLPIWICMMMIPQEFVDDNIQQYLSFPVKRNQVILGKYLLMFGFVFAIALLSYPYDLLLKLFITKTKTPFFGSNYGAVILLYTLISCIFISIQIPCLIDKNRWRGIGVTVAVFIFAIAGIALTEPILNTLYKREMLAVGSHNLKYFVQNTITKLSFPVAGAICLLVIAGFCLLSYKISTYRLRKMDL